jgi:glycosyltransferase involved in cell wall biosynthesis
MISVVMITMNEERSVDLVIDGIRQVMIDAEILIVDSSHDRTPEIAAAKGAKVIRQFPPCGYGPAMDLALRSASGEVVVTLDCDNTYPTERIPSLVKAVLVDGYDLVDGSRLGTRPAAMPLVNYLGNWGFAALASILFGRRLTDLHSGMRAYRKTLIDELQYDPNGAALPVELLLRPVKMGKAVKLDFIEYRNRLGVSTMKPLSGAWWTLKRILGVRFGRA